MKQLKQSDLIDDLQAQQLMLDILPLYVQICNMISEQPELETLHAKATKDFASLTKPALFVNAYPTVLKEVNRRVLFNKVVREDLSVLNSAIRSEIAERKRFFTECGEGMHETFMDEL